ncbi:hypothetical protein [Microbacterium testaceum]|uniref:hypothetical protein n=1 Tax=Microbacterium testaceum TaxID=2033 RepID=UPI001247D0EE|nr:hypothetical protein [Microbacterium testaceum]
MHMITRASIAVDNTVHILSIDTDVREIKRLIIDAVHRGGDFVDMTTAGNRTISVLITPTTQATLATEDVLVDFGQNERATAAYDEDYDQTDEGNWRHQ